MEVGWLRVRDVSQRSRDRVAFGLVEGGGRSPRAWPVLLVAILAHSAAACSISMPIGSLIGETEATASTSPVKPVSPLHKDLAAEDWRRARAALAVALDPQGSGKPVSWDNPETGIKGSFVPAGQPFVKSDEICREFMAMLMGQVSAGLRGTACRQGPGEWEVQSVRSKHDKSV